MPLKPVPPKEGRSKVWRIRGTHRGVLVDRSTGIAPEAKNAERRVREEITRIELSIERGDARKPITFEKAGIAYVQANGDTRFLRRIAVYFGTRTLARDIDQAAIDQAAIALYPKGSPATRNRQVYTPISAILRHAGLGFDVKRPKGAQGQKRELWIDGAQFEAVARRAYRLDPALAGMMVLAFFTGMRLGEILGMRWRDTDLGKREAKIPRTKNGDPRTVFLTTRCCVVLGAQPKGPPDARIFRFTKNGKLNAMAHKAYALAGVECGDAPFHVLRHSWATLMVRGGADLVATQAWRSAAAARNYTHFVLSEEAKKAETLPGADVPLVCIPCEDEKDE